jgi:ribosome recycling factor
MGITRMYISVTLEQNTIYMRFYLSKVVSSMLENSKWTSENVLEEIGPRIDLEIKRKSIASEDEYKRSISRKHQFAERVVGPLVTS